MEQRISIERMEQAVNLFGSFDENVRLIESEFKVTISNREGELRVNGEVEDTMLATKALNALLTLSNRGEPITEQNVRYVISLVRAGQEDRISELQSKVDPYLRPLYDALFDMLGAETYQKYLERGNIEVAPLAYMRGRTLDDSFIILDEAQNTSCEQMKMFLTRMGFNSKMVITGDVTQIDLPVDKMSGLKQAVRVLKDVEGIGICELTDQDVVRHVMVQRIIKAYADYEAARNEKRKK